MNDSQFIQLMAALGFGFGSLFWFVFFFMVFAWKPSK